MDWVRCKKIKVDNSFQITDKHLHLLVQSRFPTIWFTLLFNNLRQPSGQEMTKEAQVNRETILSEMNVRNMADFQS